MPWAGIVPSASCLLLWAGVAPNHFVLSLGGAIAVRTRTANCKRNIS